LAKISVNLEIFFAGFDIDFGKRSEGGYTHVNHAPEDHYTMIYESRCAFAKAVHCSIGDTIRRGNQALMNRCESRWKVAFTSMKIVVVNVFFCTKSFCFGVYRLPAHTVLSDRFSPCRGVHNFFCANKL